MKTKLEQAMVCVVDIFHQYCLLKKIDDNLQFKEFRKLMQEQGQQFMNDTMPPNLDQEAYIKQLFQEADKNKDGNVKFTEFLCTFARFLDNAHHRSHNLDEGEKTSGHGHGHAHGHGHGHSH
ncbi:protein S100-A12-like [Paroedura picta]|uniref:protein S100-A12-like n=1 Tax=Paroedura picta TaxID=143630 RepID=UPI004056F5A6